MCDNVVHGKKVPDVSTNHATSGEITVFMNIGKGWKLPGTNDRFLDALAGLAGDYGDEFAEILEEIVEQRKHGVSRETVFIGEDE